MSRVVIEPTTLGLKGRAGLSDGVARIRKPSQRLDKSGARIIVAPEAPWCCTAKGGHARQEVFDHVQIANTSSWTRERERKSRPPEACPLQQRRRGEAQRLAGPRKT